MTWLSRARYRSATPDGLERWLLMKVVSPRFRVTGPFNRLLTRPFSTMAGRLNGLWVMANAMVCFFMVHTRRSKEAFEELTGASEGILVSDDHAVYRKWVNARQTCLTHHIRRAKALSESTRPERWTFGTWARKELQRLVKMANAPPTHHFPERTISFGVLWRKKSQGTKRDSGSFTTLRTVGGRRGHVPIRSAGAPTLG